MPSKSNLKLDRKVALSKKAVLSTPEHAVLLQWLIENRESICAQFIWNDEAWYAKEVGAAHAEYREKVENLVQGLTVGASNEKASPGYRDACKAKLTWVKGFLKKYSNTGEPDYKEAITPIITEWHAQARTFEPDVILRDHTLKRVGFVDLSVSMRLATSLTLKFYDDHIYVPESLGTDEDKHCIERIAAIKLFEPKWQRASYSYHRCWFDVWSTLPSLGDLLQHLKLLRELNPTHYSSSLNARVETSTFLVVPTIEKIHSEIIEHEGFSVVAKDEIEVDNGS